jgi:hypothetical protein
LKAITIHQPWASLIAYGHKKFETRSWKTNYRGPIAIHASKKRDMEFIWELKNKYPEIWQAIPAFPTGAIVAVAELAECWRMVYHPGPDVGRAKHIPFGAEADVPRDHPNFSRYIVPTETEKMFGDWRTGRYAWELANVRLLPDPIPAKGQQGLWNWGVDEDG